MNKRYRRFRRSARDLEAELNATKVEGKIMQGQMNGLLAVVLKMNVTVGDLLRSQKKDMDEIVALKEEILKLREEKKSTTGTTTTLLTSSTTSTSTTPLAPTTVARVGSKTITTEGNNYRNLESVVCGGSNACKNSKFFNIGKVTCDGPKSCESATFDKVGQVICDSTKAGGWVCYKRRACAF